MKPLVSIVIPIYNMGDSIESCVKSVLNQDYGNYEVILVDDGSKDNSLEVCNHIAESSSLVKVVHTENRGSGPARNTGIENASGKYIYFPDSDDYIEPNTISRLVEAMEDGKYDLVVFGFKNVNTKGVLVSEKTYPELSQYGDDIRMSYADYMTTSSRLGIQGAPWNKFFDMDVIREYQLEYPPLRRHQDEGFIGRYMCYAKHVHFIEDVLYTYYTNDLSREWKKYPVDYIDAVTGLYQVRKETILTWNDKDVLTHEMIYREFICNVIKSLELSFSPKMAFGCKERIKWMQKTISNSKLLEVQIPSILGVYQKTILFLLRTMPLWVTYNALHFKTIVEQKRRK